MNEFFNCEKKGRLRLKSFLDQIGGFQQYETTDPLDEVDYYAFKEGCSSVFEIKVRNLIDKRTQKLYDEVILSTNKVKAINDRMQRYNLQFGFYACFFQDYLYLFDVNKCPKREEKWFCPKTTCGDDHNLIDRDLYYFKLEDAWVYKADKQWELVSLPRYARD